MILAAGYGTRLRPYTDHTPKPLFSIAGRPLLDIIIDQLQKAGCKAVIINTHHLHHKIEAFLAAQNYSLEVNTRFEPQILGTGGAIKNVADFWDNQPFMVVNADIVAEIDLKEVYRAHCRHHPPATLVLCDDPAFNSVAVRQNKWISGFYDHADGSQQSPDDLLTFTGIQVLDPLFLNYIPDKTFYSSIDAFKQILAGGKSSGLLLHLRTVGRISGRPNIIEKQPLIRPGPKLFNGLSQPPPPVGFTGKSSKGTDPKGSGIV